MRFGIWTASGMRPNDFRIRFLPVKDCAIVVPCGHAEDGSRASIVHPASTLGSPLREPDAGKSPLRRGRSLAWSEGDGPCLGVERAKTRVLAESEFREARQIGLLQPLGKPFYTEKVRRRSAATVASPLQGLPGVSRVMILDLRSYGGPTG